ncbi:MAG: hypothetical protein HZA01_01175 [Nitrospinae bacterium]|nr:hypothetical protein [Nitrospinota bacterium]
MSNKARGKKAEDKIKDALVILNNLGLPRQQQNERSALTLLALLGLRPAGKWEDARCCSASCGKKLAGFN